MSINLYDSLERKLKELKPAQPDGVFRFYNCGPTVYAPAHIGNFRTFVINDVLRRLLELEFPGKVKHVRNLTDVDDRTIGQAQKEKLPLAAITKKWTDAFHADCAALNCLPPHAEPTATGYIKEQVNMIEVLMEKGNAYRAADGSVYFKVSSFADYGRLSRVKERELLVTDATADSDHKNSVSDFALWKACKPAEDGDVKWPGPRGAAEGRPGWHIECSAMSKALLGDTIDLHTGGEDLEFPHHENEIAQSECCNGVPFARHWFHSKHLLVDGTTMSKSKGNYYTLGDLLAKGISPLAIRLALLGGHPRKQLNFMLATAQGEQSAINSILKSTQYFCKAADRPLADLYSPECRKQESWDPFEKTWENLCDDLNFPEAFGRFFLTLAIADSNKGMKTSESESEFNSLGKVLFALGIDLRPFAVIVDAPAEITALAERRWAARQAKDFAGADALRKELAAQGWAMKDGKEGYKLEPVKK